MVELLHWRVNLRADTPIGPCPHTVILPATVTSFLLYIAMDHCRLRNLDIKILGHTKTWSRFEIPTSSARLDSHGCLIIITLLFIVVGLSDVAGTCDSKRAALLTTNNSAD